MHAVVEPSACKIKKNDQQPDSGKIENEQVLPAVVASTVHSERSEESSVDASLR